MKYNIYLFKKKKSKSFYISAADEYIKRLSRYCKATSIRIKKQKDWESKWQSEAYKVLLLPGPDSVSSEAFSNHIKEWEMRGQGTIAFFIPDLSEQSDWYEDMLETENNMLLSGGLDQSPNNKDPAIEILNLSDFHLSPELTRVVLLEQIYRGYRIMHNHPYHK